MAIELTIDTEVAPGELPVAVAGAAPLEVALTPALEPDPDWAAALPVGLAAPLCEAPLDLGDELPLGLAEDEADGSSFFSGQLKS
jgi:hypothetical protein